MIVRRSLTVAAFVACVAFISGCATGPLEVEYMAGMPPFTLTKQRAVVVEPLLDARRAPGPRYLGAIETTVYDMSSGELLLSKDASALATKALIRELRGVGFIVLEAGVLSDGVPEAVVSEAGTANGEEAVEGARAAPAPEPEYVIGGELKSLRLDIKTRDEVDIELYLKVEDARTGKLLWRGSSEVKGSRYVGVTGNTRGTISQYLVVSLGKAVVKALNDAASVLGWGQIGGPGGAGGEGAPGTPGAIRSEEAGTMQQPPPFTGGNLGTLSIKTTPPRARLYIDDVYYGLSPIIVELQPDIYKVELRLKGHEGEIEKVSVRRGKTTELEVDFEE